MGGFAFNNYGILPGQKGAVPVETPQEKALRERKERQEYLNSIRGNFPTALQGPISEELNKLDQQQATEDATLASPVAPPPASIAAPRIPSDFRLKPITTGIPALDATNDPIQVPMRPGGPGPEVEEFKPGTTSKGFVTRGPRGEILLTNQESNLPALGETQPIPKLQGTMSLQDPNLGTANIRLGGRGAFSPGAEIPALTKTFEEIQKESPAIQNIWLENVLKSNEVDRQRADLKSEAAKAGLAEAQGRLAGAEAGRVQQTTAEMAKPAPTKAYEQSKLAMEDYVRSNRAQFEPAIAGMAQQIIVARIGLQKYQKASPAQRLMWANEVEDEAIAAFAEQKSMTLALAQARAGTYMGGVPGAAGYWGGGGNP